MRRQGHQIIVTHSISNQDFIDAIFGNRAAGSVIWSACVYGEPAKAGSQWTGFPSVAGKLPAQVQTCTDQNLFYNVSAVTSANGSVGRKEENFAGLHVVVLDDIGEKAALPDGFEPSYLLETSPGNFQAGLILAEPCHDLPLLRALYSALAAGKFTDAGAKGPTSRYARLPVGVNRKEKNGPDGFPHRLAQWEPSRRFTIKGIVDALGLRLVEHGAEPATRTAKPAQDDTAVIARLLRGAKTSALWQGEDFGMGGSEGDAFLLTRLAHITKDREQIERVYGSSPRAERRSSDGVQKWVRRPDYRKRSIDAALAYAEAHPNGDVDEARETVERAVERAKAADDPRAVFEEDVIEAWGTLKRSSPGDFSALRGKCRKAGVSLGALDQVIENETQGNRLLDADAADLAIERMGGLDSVVYAQGHFWVWMPEGMWRRVESDEEIRAAIQAVLPKRQITGGGVNSIFAVLRTKVARSAKFDMQRKGFAINCLNGTLRLRDVGFDEGLRSGFWQLDPHRRDDWFTSQCPVAWEPEAQCPAFFRFLDDITRGDADALEKQRFIAEAIGYSLMPVTSEEKFFVLYGPSSSNGKSTLLNVLAQLAGSRSTTALTVTQLSERFAPAKLPGALVNVCGEIERGETLPDGLIKRICSGDPITAEFKGRDHFEFRPTVTLWFATNNLPGLRDLSPATLEKRCRLITLNRSFTGEGRDVRLGERLAGELPGIFSFCVGMAGGMALLARQAYAATTTADGTMTPTHYIGGFLDDLPSSSRAKASWRLDQDPVSQFADECVVTGDPRAWTSTEDAYAAWSNWCKSNGIALQLTSRMVTAGLKRQFPDLLVGDEGRRGRKRGIGGLALVD